MVIKLLNRMELETHYTRMVVKNAYAWGDSHIHLIQNKIDVIKYTCKYFALISLIYVCGTILAPMWVEKQ